MPLVYDDEPGSWGRLSEGWPETRVMPKSKWCFANKTHIIPYGSYVLMDSDKPEQMYLRVENKQLLKTLNDNFDIVFNCIREELGQ